MVNLQYFKISLKLVSDFKYLPTESTDYVAEAIKSHAFMHNFVPRDGEGWGWVVVVCGLWWQLVGIPPLRPMRVYSVVWPLLGRSDNLWAELGW